MTGSVGSSPLRVEDQRLLTGQARFVDDVTVPGMLHAVFVRAPIAHATIEAIDTSAALAVDGVHAVLTWADLRESVGPMTPAPAPGLFAPPYPALAERVVRHVGDPIAVVLAVDRAIAEDAASLVELTATPRPPVVDMDDAIGAQAAHLFPEHGSNVVFRSEHRYGDTDLALAGAAHVVTERFSQHRQTNAPMECRGGVAEFAPSTGELVYTTGHQSPHALRFQLAQVLRVPSHLLRVRCGDIGGAFGQKSGLSREDVVVCAAARWAGRAVKWIEDRSENLTVGGQAREERVEITIGVDADGRLLALRARMVIDVGAYPQVGFPANGFANIVRVLVPGAYRLEHYDFEAVAVCTNKATYVPYRGPWEVETWVRERMLDVVARVVGIDPVELRLRNLWRPDELPRPSVVGAELRGITQIETLTSAAELVDHRAFRSEQEASRAAGRYIGIGFANVVEPAPVSRSLVRAMGFEAAPRSVQEARMRLEPDGTFTVFTSQQPHGQGHETTLAQLAAEAVGVPMGAVRIVHGDTQMTPFNLVGTGGSRAAVMASGAVIGVAGLVRRRVLDLVAAVWELDAADLELVDGVVSARGVPSRRIPLSDVGVMAYTRPGLANADGSPGIEEACAYAAPDGTWSQATHCCTVEVDAETGRVTILRYLVVEDCGAMINPAVVEGQVRGGVVQGLAGVLFERCAYGPDGQYLTSTFLDYLVPSAADVPTIEVFHHHGEPDLEMPYRGVGEGGAIGAPAALTNAIEDALVPFGARVRDSHLPPMRIVELCAGANVPS